MNSEDLDRQLTALFTREVKERAAEMERHLLALEEAADEPERRALQERLLRISHSLKGAAGLVKARPVEAVCHRMEDLFTLLRRRERSMEKADLDVLFAATDVISEAGRLLERTGNVSELEHEDVLRRLEKRLHGGAGEHEAAPDVPALTPVVPMPPIRESDVDGSLRLPGDRLETLMYRSGELVAARSRLKLRATQATLLQDALRSMRPATARAPEAAAAFESGMRELTSGIVEDARIVAGLAGEFDHEIRRARMQPFSDICQGLPRLVRDIAAGLAKTAEFHVSGGDIELDRSIAAGLQDILRHLVRNAVGHGIEPPEARRQAGKPAKGSITVSAALDGDRVRVEVADDGRGFDVASIGRAADRMGLPAAEDEKQRLRQAFETGVSTSAELTNLSGRGIGLDIVKKVVEGMRGAVELAHRPGQGATVTLVLPATLTTVQALEIAVADQHFTIDVASVTRVARLPVTSLPAAGGSGLLDAEGRPARFLDLSRWLGFPSLAPANGSGQVPVVFLRAAGSEIALIVERIVGQQELVVRSLGERLSSLRSYSGATVLPDGRVALLLNTAALLEAAALQEAPAEEPPRRGGFTPKRRVLVVDDSSSVRSLQKLILEEAGYEVALAGDGKEALKHLRAHGADVVVADVDMPVMDGLDLTQAIRRSRKFADLPVILVTGRDTPEEKAEGLRVGATAYVPKSGFDQQHFLETVARVV